MNVDAFDEFNAETIIGYRGDIWETIKQLSGLWKSDGRLCNITEWQKKLPGIETNRRDAFNRKFQDGRRSLWFNFSVKRELPQRSADLHLHSLLATSLVVLLVTKRRFR